MKRWFAVSVVAALTPTAAQAEPGLAGEVYSPQVLRGLTEAEVRGGVLDGGDADGEWQLKTELSHGITDWWRLGVVAEWEQEGGETEFSAFAVENVVDFTGTRSWPVHFGGYFEYEFAQDGPDAVELKLLMEHARGPLDLRLNLIGERLVGDSAENEWELGYAAQAAFALNDDVEVGLQGFGDAGADDDFGHLGDEAHYWGPFTQFEVGDLGGGEVELQLGYLAGFGEAEADGQFRVKLEYEIGGNDHDSR